MRIPGFVAAVAIGASALTPQVARTEVLVIVDADALVANAGATAPLRQHARAEVERYGHAVYFELTANAIRPVPAEEADSFRRPIVLDALLRRAAEYVTQFVATFSAVIWREHCLQEDRLPRKFTASGTSFSTLAAERQLESELLLVWLPKDASWIAVRDVIAIDGKLRSPGDRQLPALLSGQAVSVDQLKTLAAENGRFNIGAIVHTFNEPTLVLLFLDEHYRNRFTFARNGEQRLKGQRATRYDFVERARPTIIQNGDRDVPVRGTLWIDAATGRVLQTSLELSDPSGRLHGRMTVRYGPHPRFDVLVPLEMREWYTSPSGEEVTTVATYTDFRRFETAGRLIVPR